MRLVSSLQSTVEPDPKRLNDGTMLTDCKPREVHIIFVEGESLFLSEAKLQVCEILPTPYYANLEEFLAMTLEEVDSIDVITGNLEKDADWDLADQMGVSDIRCRGSIRADSERLREACSVVNSSVPSSVAELLSLAIRGLKVTSRAFVLEVGAGVL